MLCRDLRGHGGDASKKSGSALIISLCKAGQAWEALKVYEDMTAPPPPPMPTSHEEQAGNWFSNVQTASTVLTSPEAHANSSFQQAASPRSATPNKGNVQTATDATSHVSAGTLHSPDQSSQQSRFRTLSADGSPAEGPSMTNRAFDDANAHNTVTNTPSQPKPVGRAAANQLHAEQLNEQATAGANISETRSTDDHSAPSHAPDMQQATSANSERPHAAAAIQQPPNTAPQVVSGSPLQLVRPTRRSSIPREGVEAQQSTAATTAKGPAVRSGHGTTSQSSPGPNGSEQRVGEVAGDSSGGRLELHSSTRLSQRVTFPSISATAALVHAFALAGNFHQCHRSALHYACILPTWL